MFKQNPFLFILNNKLRFIKLNDIKIGTEYTSISSVNKKVIRTITATVSVPPTHPAITAGWRLPVSDQINKCIK